MRIIKQKYYKAEGARGNALDVSIGYEEGGYNPWNGRTDRRGYYAYASPCSVHSRGDGVRSVSCAIFDGAKVFLQEAKRFSQKTADSLNIDLVKVTQLIDFVAKEYGMTVEFDEVGNPVEVD